jgi:hypothetical protein
MPRQQVLHFLTIVIIRSIFRQMHIARGIFKDSISTQIRRYLAKDFEMLNFVSIGFTFSRGPLVKSREQIPKRFRFQTP